MNESLNMNKTQLDMGFGQTKSNRRRPSQQRQRRAQWWFQQMRVVVDSAVDWNTVPDARPEQIMLGWTRSE